MVLTILQLFFFFLLNIMYIVLCTAGVKATGKLHIAYSKLLETSLSTTKTIFDSLEKHFSHWPGSS